MLRLRALGLLALLLTLSLAACKGGDTEPPIDATEAEDSAQNVPDAALDATSDDFCTTCGADEICVQRFDGVCNETFLDCVPTKVECPDNVCSTECEAALCGGDPYQCENRPPCGTEVTDAFTCYGP